jgi:hypothetical protein
VAINATGVSFRTFRAASLDLVLTDVDVTAKTAGTVAGTVEAASLSTPDGIPANADIRIDGTGSRATTRIASLEGPWIVSSAPCSRIGSESRSRERSSSRRTRRRW